MKANEAPENIYLLPDDRNSTNLSICWYEAPYSTGAIEYTRTDAFIEKALKFLDEKFYFNNLHYCIESGVFDSEEEMFEDFKKYMGDSL
jgi:hypothetical protein